MAPVAPSNSRSADPPLSISGKPPGYTGAAFLFFAILASLLNDAMRLKLLRRRLTISAPRVAVRSAMPWPLRWALVAIVFGFCAAIALWAFEFGKGLAGLDSGSRDELAQLRQESVRLREERDRAQSVANTAGSLLTTERTAQEHLLAQIKRLEAENRELRDNLGFFEKLLPTAANDGVVIRGLQAEVLGGAQLKWQVLVMQPAARATEFNGRIEITLDGLHNGKPWFASPQGGAQALQLRQYRRLEGVLELPPQTVVKTVTAKVYEGNSVRAVQSFRL